MKQNGKKKAFGEALRNLEYGDIVKVSYFGIILTGEYVGELLNDPRFIDGCRRIKFNAGTMWVSLKDIVAIKTKQTHKKSYELCLHCSDQIKAFLFDSTLEVRIVDDSSSSFPYVQR